MDAFTKEQDRLADLPIARDRDLFLRELIRELSGSLEDIVGLEEAAGLISLIGGRIGGAMNTEYCEHLQVDRMALAQVAAALVDLKRRIEGGFTIESVDDDKITLVNSRCPFGEYVKDRPSLCMMTSNVFGKIAAENMGYARVDLDETIADGDGRCRVHVHLTSNTPAETLPSREYFRVNLDN